jgi:hypothetical protein
MVSLKKSNTAKNVAENLEVYRANYKWGLESYNNRNYDPFHLFATDYNKNNIKKILDSYRENYFTKPECYTCSGNIEPRPMPCFGCKDCHFFPHYRGSKKSREESPLMEISIKTLNSNLSIYLSRATLSWLLDHQEYDFIVRTTYVNQWVFHHANIDRFDDSSGNIRIVRADWHLNTHRELKDRNLKISKLESMLLLKDDVTIKKELELQKRLKHMVIERLLNVPDDPDILRSLFEIQNYL